MTGSAGVVAEQLEALVTEVSEGEARSTFDGVPAAEAHVADEAVQLEQAQCRLHQRLPERQRVDQLELLPADTGGALGGRLGGQGCQHLDVRRLQVGEYSRQRHRLVGLSLAGEAVRQHLGQRPDLLRHGRASRSLQHPRGQLEPRIVGRGELLEQLDAAELLSRHGHDLLAAIEPPAHGPRVEPHDSRDRGRQCASRCGIQPVGLQRSGHRPADDVGQRVPQHLASPLALLLLIGHGLDGTTDRASNGWGQTLLRPPAGGPPGRPIRPAAANAFSVAAPRDASSPSHEPARPSCNDEGGGSLFGQPVACVQRARAGVKHTGGRPMSDTGFPAKTPVDVMTAEQRAAYWRHHACRHEARNQALKTELYEVRQSVAAELERVRTQSAAELAELRAARVRDWVRTEFALALTPDVGRMDALLEDLLFERFLTTDGAVDVARVREWVARVPGLSRGEPR